MSVSSVCKARRFTSGQRLQGRIIKSKEQPFMKAETSIFRAMANRHLVLLTLGSVFKPEGTA
jgi:hypothetical protein